MTGIQIEWAFPWDRPGISFSLGSAMLMAAAIPVVFNRLPYAQSAALLIALAFGAHTASNITYRDENRKMK